MKPIVLFAVPVSGDSAYGGMDHIQGSYNTAGELRDAVRGLHPSEFRKYQIVLSSSWEVLAEVETGLPFPEGILGRLP